ncbi:hypothetical protein lbkm_2423 [Lachnospiraceae bacterium KM106-2]|nr:hypothetical protein lbkm_2423 [Lachnospiraceae bacterium KM106-2]
MYHGKKMLYALGKTANPNNIVMEEGKNSLPYQPILLKVNDQEGALLYLDGKSRNYEELRQAQQFYEARQMKTHWFLHKKYQTNSRNLTSDEAEVARINDDILYYLDTDHGKIDFRKAYQSPYGERRYYTETISLENLMLDDEGEFDRSFLEDYKEHVKKQRQALDCILRLPMEEGLDEIYFSFSYCYMDSIEEIWILPKLQMPLEEAEFNERARKQREYYVEQCNAMLLQVPREEQDELVREILKYVNRRQKVSNWLS